MNDYTPSEIEIYMWEQGIVLRDISLIAFDRGLHKIQAIGYEAQNMTVSGIELCSPLKNGHIADWENSRKMFAYFFSKVWKKRFRRQKVAVCMAENATEVEKTAMKEAMQYCGAKEVLLSELPLGQFIHTIDRKTCDMVIGIRAGE